LKTQSQWEEENRWQNMLRVDAGELPSVNEKLAERLTRGGFDSAQDIIDAPRDELLEIQGVGPIKLTQILEEAEEFVKNRVHQIEVAKKLDQESSATEINNLKDTEE